MLDLHQLIITGVILVLIVGLLIRRRPRHRRRMKGKSASAKLHSKNLRAASFLLGNIAKETNEGSVIAVSIPNSSHRTPGPGW